jgi:serine/threonine protein kinase
MAPEVEAGREVQTPAADLWAAGSLLMALLTGEAVASARDAESRVDKELCGEAADLARQLLATDSRLRPTASDALQHAWFRAAASAGVSPGGDVFFTFCQ